MTEKFENDWTRTVEKLSPIIEKLRADKAALLEACRATEKHFTMLCVVTYSDDPPLMGIPLLKQIRAAIAQAESKEG